MKVLSAFCVILIFAAPFFKNYSCCDLFLFQATQPIKYNNEHRLNVEEKKPRSSESIRGRGGMGRGGGPGFGGRSGGQGYSAERGGSGGRGGMKSGGGGFNNRQDMRGSPSLGPRGGFSQQGRR